MHAGRRLGFGRTAIALLVLVASAHKAGAEPWTALGARHLALGGAGVAIVDADLAGYWNPAALAFAQGWSVQLPGGVQASTAASRLQPLNDVFASARAQAAVFESVRSSQALLPAQARQAVGFFAGELPRLAPDATGGSALQTNAGFGASAHNGPYGFSALSLTVASVEPVYAPSALALSSVAGNAAASIANVVGTGPFDSPADAALALEVTAAAPAWSVGQAGQLVAFAEQAGVATGGAPARAALVQVAVDTANAAPEGNAWENASGAALQGFSTQEIGFSYADRIPVSIFPALDKRVGFGWTLRYMYGIHFRDLVRYRDGRSVADTARDLSSMPGRTGSHNVGLDLAFDARLARWLRFGVVARNINSPSFDKSGGGDLDIDPQVRGGIAVCALPALPGLVLALDADLLENGSLGAPRFHSRQIAAGAEYRIGLAQATALALRLGTQSNLASGMDHDVLLSGGFGLRWRQLAVDFAGGASTELARIDSQAGASEIPSAFHFGLSLGWQQSL